MLRWLPAGWPRAALGLATALALLPPSSAAATTFTVDSLQDVRDQFPGDGQCAAFIPVSGGGGIEFTTACTLRAAIQEANILSDPVTVMVPDATYVLSAPNLPDDDEGAIGDLDVTGDVTLVPVGGGSNIDLQDQPEIDAAFEVHPGGRLRLTGIRIQDSFNAGIVNRGELHFADAIINGVGGSAIYNKGGSVEVLRARLVENLGFAEIDPESGVLVTVAGGITNLGGTVSVRESAILASFGSAGALSNISTPAGDALLVVVNSTLTANNALGITITGSVPFSVDPLEIFVGGSGGAIFQEELGGSATSILRSTTILRGKAEVAGGGIFVGGGTVEIMNTVLSENTVGDTTPEDCVGSLVSAGYSLLEAPGPDCDLVSGPGDRIGVPADLGPTSLEGGGPTDTSLPAPSSPLVNGGDPAGCRDWIPDADPQPLLTRDQRGLPRVSAGRCDIGAVELVPEPGAAAAGGAAVAALATLARRRRGRDRPRDAT